MASVWLARFGGRLGFERLVVVKMILPQFSQDPRFQNMFLDEARIASKIEHANVARILDVGEEAGNYFIVMDWIDGDSLSKVMRGATELRKELMPPGVALRIAADAAAGLYAAHELKERDGTHLAVVHRDVSPQNILVANTGATVIIDFGVAKARDRIAQDTTAGQLKGKIRYMAPEQALGRALDHRADLFALGAILYEMFSGGKPPYEGVNDVATLHLLTSGAERKPLPEGTPPLVQDIIDRAMAYDPKDRFAHALELQEALEDAMVEIGAPTNAAAVAEYTADLLAERKTARRKAVDKALDLAHRRDQAKPPPSSSSNAVPSSGPMPSGTVSMRVSFPSSRTAPPVVVSPPSTPSHPSGHPGHVTQYSRPGAPPSGPMPYGGGPTYPPHPMADPYTQSGVAEPPSIASHGTMHSTAMEYAQPPQDDGGRRRRYLIAAAVGVALAVNSVLVLSFLVRREESRLGSANGGNATELPAPAVPLPSAVPTVPASTSPPAAPEPAATAPEHPAEPEPSARASTHRAPSPTPSPRTKSTSPPQTPTATGRPDRGF
jgi:serine/threonine-protein kinase